MNVIRVKSCFVEEEKKQGYRVSGIKMGCQPYNRCIELFNRNDDAITDPYSDSAVKNPEFKVQKRMFKSGP